MNSFGKVGQVVRPDGHGARQWRERHGESLVCVRYRYDEATRLRHTTVELVVSSSPWQPPDLEPVFLRVNFDEIELRNTLKNHGGIWEPTLRRWRTTRRTARELHLEDRLDKPSSPL